MAVIISIINNKGGVGKTTSTAVLAELMAYLGKKVLIVDLDPQANLSLLFNSYTEDSKAVIIGINKPEKENVCELFKYRYREEGQVRTLIYPTEVVNIDIIPSSTRQKHSPSNIIMNTGNNNIILKKALHPVSKNYDFILIDNAPASDILTVNSMFASDYVLVPVRVEEFSLKGLKETLDSILYIKEEHDLDTLQFLGAFITQAETNTKIFKYNHNRCIEALQQRFLKTPIRKDKTIGEMETFFQPILGYNANTNALLDYAALLLEMNILDSDSAEMLLQSIS